MTRAHGTQKEQTHKKYFHLQDRHKTTNHGLGAFTTSGEETE